MGLDMLWCAAQRTDDTCDNQFFKPAIDVSRTQIDKLDPFLKSFHVLPVRFCKNCMQSEAESACIVHLLVHFPLLLGAFCIVIDALLPMQHFRNHIGFAVTVFTL
jgi:hypothetical protein